ncbi:MAG: hypothetical protein WCB35_08185, partial [Methanoregula sp.]|uniref:hypothetical protein n=2 Tax=Methanoregula sp. TaxID=2052170 RepID=UPI003C71C994
RRSRDWAWKRPLPKIRDGSKSQVNAGAGTAHAGSDPKNLFPITSRHKLPKKPLCFSGLQVCDSEECADLQSRKKNFKNY